VTDQKALQTICFYFGCFPYPKNKSFQQKMVINIEFQQTARAMRDGNKLAQVLLFKQMISIGEQE
jgi:hypothetical protein